MYGPSVRAYQSFLEQKQYVLMHLNSLVAVKSLRRKLLKNSKVITNY